MRPARVRQLRLSARVPLPHIAASCVIVCALALAFVVSVGFLDLPEPLLQIAAGVGIALLGALIAARILIAATEAQPAAPPPSPQERALERRWAQIDATRERMLAAVAQAPPNEALIVRLALVRELSLEAMRAWTRARDDGDPETGLAALAAMDQLELVIRALTRDVSEGRLA